MGRACFGLLVVALTVPVGQMFAGEPVGEVRAERVKTTVKVDRGSGRLVRTATVVPVTREVVKPAVVGKEVSPLEVLSREVASLPHPVAGASSTSVANGNGIVADRENVRKIVDETAAKHGVDPLLARSVLEVESNYNQFAVSPKGALGYMQLMPATAKQMGVQNAFDARQNIEGGVRYLRYLKSKFDDERLVLAAYNAGEAAVKKHGWIPPYPETMDYVYKVGKKYGLARSEEARAGALKNVSPVVEPVKPQPRIQQTVDAEGRILIQMP